MIMGLVFTGNPPTFSGEITAEVPTATYSGISSDDASTSINPYTGQGPGAGGAGQTSSEIEVERAGGPATDPDFSSVIALLHFDGANGSTVFTDSSDTGLTFTNAGTPTISTAESQFGGSSGLFEKPGEATASNSDAALSLSNTDFTIEAWVFYLTSAIGTNGIGGTGTLQGSFGAWMRILSNNTVQVFIGRGIGPTAAITSAAISRDTWTHIAFTFVTATDTMTVWINGVDNGTETSTLDPVATNCSVGRQYSETSGQALTDGDFEGYIDEFRITKGVARYTSNFTPPTEAFPDE